MIARGAGASWQTILADLSLILFMVTAAALADAPADAPLGPAMPGDTAANDHRTAPAPRPSPSPTAPPPPIAPSLRAEPIGVWQDEPGAPPLAVWLGEVGRDPRLRATIAVRYRQGARADALARAVRLSEVAGSRAATARIVIEAGARDGASVSLGYDSEDSGTKLD